jgi:hypothetical protein
MDMNIDLGKGLEMDFFRVSANQSKEGYYVNGCFQFVSAIIWQLYFIMNPVPELVNSLGRQ